MFDLWRRRQSPSGWLPVQKLLSNCLMCCGCIFFVCDGRKINKKKLRIINFVANIIRIQLEKQHSGWRFCFGLRYELTKKNLSHRFLFFFVLLGMVWLVRWNSSHSLTSASLLFEWFPVCGELCFDFDYCNKNWNKNMLEKGREGEKWSSLCRLLQCFVLSRKKELISVKELHLANA